MATQRYSGLGESSSIRFGESRCANDSITREPADAERSIELLQPIIDTMEASVAILDGRARFAAVNQNWPKFWKAHQLRAPDALIGLNYLEICEPAFSQVVSAAQLRTGLLSVLAGRKIDYRQGYSFPVAGIDCQFILTVNNLVLGEDRWIVVSHYEVPSASGSSDYPLARLRDQLAIEEAERRRIARELHDSTGQHLAAISMLLRRMEDLGQGPIVRQMIEEAEFATGEALKEMRSFSYLLHPPSIEKQGLLVAIKHLVEGYSLRIDLPIALEVEVPSPLSLTNLDVAIFRIVQEALANVHRHAKASRASVYLGADHRELRLIIEDDGCGLDTDSEYRGVGIAAMKARAELLGGTLEFASLAKGTRLSVRIPVRS